VEESDVRELHDDGFRAIPLEARVRGKERPTVKGRFPATNGDVFEIVRENGEYSNQEPFNAIDSRLASMRRFRCFAVSKNKKEDATKGTDQNTTDPNQSIRHEEFLSGCVGPANVP